MTLGIIGSLLVISLAMLLRPGPGWVRKIAGGAESSLNGTKPVVSRLDYNLDGLSLSQAISTRSFWFIAIAYFSFASYLTLTLTHVVPYAADRGISPIQSSTILSVMSGISVALRPAVGKISDSVGRKLPAILGAILGASAMVWLIWAYELWMFYLFAVIFGFSWAGVGIIIMTLPSDVFGGRSLGSIMGALEVGFALGSAAGAALGGFVFDVSGSYASAFAISSAVILMAGISVALSRREYGRDLTRL
jgi:MFS family permease